MSSQLNEIHVALTDETLPSVDAWFELFTALVENVMVKAAADNPSYGVYLMKAIAFAPVWVRYHRTLLEGGYPLEADLDGAHAYYLVAPYVITGISTLHINHCPVYVSHFLWDALVNLHNKSHK